MRAGLPNDYTKRSASPQPTLSARIRNLDFGDVILSTPGLALQATTILRQFPHLSRLSLPSLTPGSSSAEFLQTVAALPHLESLSIATASWSTETIDWAAIRWMTQTLPHLRIACKGAYDHLYLLLAFADTVESVVIVCEDDLERVDLTTPFARSSFPRLRSLRLEGHVDAIARLLSLPAFATAPIRQLEISFVHHEDSTSNARRFLSTLESWPHGLRYLSITLDDDPLLFTGVATEVKAFCAVRGVRSSARASEALARGGDYHADLKYDDGAYTDAALVEFVEGVERVLATARTLAGRIRDRRDTKATLSCIEKLEGLLELQALEDD